MPAMSRVDRRTFVGGLATLVATGTAVSARSAPLAKIRIGTVPIDSYGQPYYGDAAGIFRDAGIEVDVVSLANSGAIASAMLGGSIDVGIGSPSGIAGARSNGFPFTFFAPGPVYSIDITPTSLLMVAKDSPVKAAGDLVGKTIAVDLLKSVPQVGTMLWLEKNGVDPSTVKWLELPFSSMAAALGAGRVDAGTIAEPALSAARPTTRTLANYSAAIAPHYFVGAWFTTETWIKANLALAHQLARAVALTSTWATAHPEDTAIVLERISKMSHDVILRMNRCPFGTKLDPVMLEAPIAAAAKTGMIAGAMPADALIYPGFAAT
jgi:NitT/TauT family transport system substrate-binding protein